MADLSWTDAFKNIGGGLGTGLGGIGTIWSAYNANKLGNMQVDLAKQQNQLYMDKYEQDKKDKESLNNSFASVWGN
ncbi:hypothetical protein N5U04_09855 [Aliarcobacter butzleri]|uniref:hypothetical protein n=1 Tax=Arcobacteraceae TaxID=2808963 RepID=UPI0021B46282|nr:MULTISPECIES: hypothetical protein [Arcobacteraceae]MCT7549818.1 hypothetical protein [Aliarcobacter butzleri]MCT7559872.1 hypothetical protein [Aliarcobacter butzleri]MCT7911656.1 hypothetical protein [Arcobacter lacus]